MLIDLGAHWMAIIGTPGEDLTLLSSLHGDGSDEDPTAFDIALSGVENLVLSQYEYGFDITSSEYRDSLISALDEIVDLYGFED